MGGHAHEQKKIYNVSNILLIEEKIPQEVYRPNPTGTALAQLLQLKQRHTGIQEYATKALTLAHHSQIGNQRAKTLIFNELLNEEQVYIMLANAQMMEEQLGRDIVEDFLHQTNMMLWR